MCEIQLIMKDLSLYIHWPFCLSKCPYCDFNSHVVNEIDQSVWREGLLTEMKTLAKYTEDRKLKSVFFGGGTPSLMKPQIVADIISEAKKIWQTDSLLEISLEANPSSVEAKKLYLFNQAGINRISLGIQSFNDITLKFLGREHNAADSKRALEIAKKTFQNVSFDMIYATPEQTTQDWALEIKQAIQFSSNHLSVYQLTIERGTAFFQKHRKKEFEMLDGETLADLYEFTQDKLGSAGLENYEISNHAKPSFECVHNLQYWKMRDYLGIGAGAHSRITDKEGVRWAFRTHRAPNKWLSETKTYGHAITEKVCLSLEDQIFETLMMGLRLKTGVSTADFKNTFKKSIEEIFTGDTLKILLDEQLVELDNESFRATSLGRQKLDSLIQFLFSDFASDHNPTFSKEIQSTNKEI